MSKNSHPILQSFLDERKAKKLKAKIKETTPEEEVATVTEELDTIFEFNNWVADAAPRAGQISIASHPSKFSHPDAGKNDNGDTSSVIATSELKKDGYLRSGNVAAKMDAIGNAAALDVYAFLHLEIDGMSLIEHFESDTEVAKKSFSSIEGFSYAELKASFLEMVEVSSQAITSSRIKQIYFPVVGDPRECEDYHLLSVISNSGLIYEMRHRLDEMHFSDKTKELKELRKKDGYSDESYAEVFNLVTLGYGGTKPQNISVQNSQNGGRAYLLRSEPPVLEKRAARFPTKDFFSQCIYKKDLTSRVKALHAYYKDSRNNMELRGKYTGIVESIMEDVVMRKVWQLRDVAETQYHEESSQLPDYQRVWITGTFDERYEDDEWLDTLVKEAATWLLNSYRSIIGEEKFIMMGDTEHEDLIEKINSCLTQKENLR